MRGGVAPVLECGRSGQADANLANLAILVEALRPALSPPLRGRKQILGLGKAKSLEFAREGIILPTMRQAVPPPHRSFARKMRADATKAENVLWQALRRKQLEGLKFKRQVPLDGYILDFVCFDAKLVVEVDGSQHAESAQDQARDRHFEAAGFRVLRFWNDDVLTGLDGVCMVILREAQGRLGDG
ncbi:endonuclease domain-containing protein [Mesorhizobium sp. 10J20-29]